MKIIQALFVFSCLFAVALSWQWPWTSNAPLPVAQDVDLDSYLGQWYEISLLPYYWEKDCYCTQANYSVNEDNGKIVVNNTCHYHSSSNPITSMVGRAWVQGNDTAKLSVEFFFPFSADYWIINVAQDYSWALVGNPNREYLWILSRTPTLDQATYDDLVQQANGYGFPTQDLLLTVQDCGSNFV